MVRFSLTILMVLVLVIGGPIARGQRTDDLFHVFVNEKICFIDNTGKIILRTQFDDFVSDFHEGLAEFMDQHAVPSYPFSKSGYIDLTGKLVIKPQFDQAYDFSNGRAHVVIGDLSSFIDKMGKQVIKFGPYQAPRSFSEGLAAVQSNFEFWYIDRNGKTTIPKQTGLAKDFKEGLACVYLPVNQKLKAGYIDKMGKVIISPQFDDCSDFSEGLALIKIDEKYGYIDKTGGIVISPRFSSAYNFSNGRARATTNDKWGFIDSKGQFVIPERYDVSTGDFSEGLAAVCSDNKCGYMDIHGTWAIKPNFQFAYDFRNGLAKVDYRTYIDKTGKVVWPPEINHELP